MTNNAVVYVAWGDDFVALARKSLASLKKHTPDVKAYLFTDKMRDRGLFDQLDTIKVYNKRPETKVNGILLSCDIVKEERVIYLDSDTLVLGDISDLFGIGRWFDFAIAHAPFRRPKGKNPAGLLSSAFPVFNSGVIMYSPIYAVKRLFLEWADRVVGQKADQFILSDLLYFDLSADIELCFTVLSQEYNARTGWPFCVQGEVKIIHGMANLEQVASVVNQKPGLIRVWMPGKGMIYK